MDGNGWKYMEMDEHIWKWMEWLDLAVNFCKSWKYLEWLEKAENRWK